MAQAVGTAAVGATARRRFADFDDDGGWTCSSSGKGATLYHNAGNVSSTTRSASGIAVRRFGVWWSTYNNDGSFDRVRRRPEGSPSTLWLNDGIGKFRRDTAPTTC
jgi:hypothetical protein